MGMNSIDAEDDQFAYRYDTQLLIDRRDKDWMRMNRRLYHGSYRGKQLDRGWRRRIW